MLPFIYQIDSIRSVCSELEGDVDPSGASGFIFLWEIHVRVKLNLPFFESFHFAFSMVVCV